MRANLGSFFKFISILLVATGSFFAANLSVAHQGINQEDVELRISRATAQIDEIVSIQRKLTEILPELLLGGDEKTITRNWKETNKRQFESWVYRLQTRIDSEFLAPRLSITKLGETQARDITLSSLLQMKLFDAVDSDDIDYFNDLLKRVDIDHKIALKHYSQLVTGELALSLGSWVTPEMIDKSCDGKERKAQITRQSVFPALHRDQVLEGYVSVDSELHATHFSWSLLLNPKTAGLFFNSEGQQLRIGCDKDFFMEIGSDDKSITYDKQKHLLTLEEDKHIKLGSKNPKDPGYLYTFQIINFLHKYYFQDVN